MDLPQAESESDRAPLPLEMHMQISLRPSVGAFETTLNTLITNRHERDYDHTLASARYSTKKLCAHLEHYRPSRAD